MKRILRRTAAIIASAVLTVCTQPFSAFAEDDGDIKFPSGVPVSSVIKIQEKIDAHPYNIKKRDKSNAHVELIFHGDEILYTRYYGCTNIEEHTLADENSVFEWGSISKTFTWVSIMQLWEQGKIDLEADIRTYLPDNFFRHLKYDDPITLMDIMNHKGGWCEKFYDSTSADMAAMPSLEEALRNTEPAQTYRPGEVASYSNWAAALAGLIVQRVSGMDYVEYVHKNIFEPLGMEHTTAGPDFTDNPWVREQRLKTICYETSLHKSYIENEYGIIEDEMIEEYKSKGTCLFNDQLYPCGAITGTLGDLATYAQAFVNDDHPLFQNAETQEKLLSGSSFYGNTDIPCFSYGFDVKEYNYTRTFGHTGSTFGCVANMEFDPVSKFGVVGLSNCGDDFPNSLCASVFGRLKAQKYIGEDYEKADMTPYSGYYSNTRTHAAGMGKFILYMDAFSIDNINAAKVADDVFLEYHSEDYYDDSIYGIVYNSDGTRGIVNSCSEYLEIKHYVPKLCLLAGFMLCGVASLFILLAKRKLNKAHKAAPLSFAHIITAGQFAKIISLAAMISIVVIRVKGDNDGLTKTEGTVIGIIQFVCLAVCGLALIAAAYSFIAKKKLPYGRIRSLSCFAGNLITVSAMFFFEMYNFWCC
ncbi:MAG: beta-lactamase family protein [Ruminococcus sp.]|uniref:serine hydrolase domain-containing protein n=1 Tax=Ruminococcus sp. TaxID=41978 RepID=UPI0025DA5149|nr:serine hydrolase domain-containing protein [Ruminococcus sp.]MCR5600777.1 beta-lactamase family protein [Ruminococcus sp.]